MEFPQKMKNGTAFWPSDPISGYICEETRNSNSKEYMHPYDVLCSILYNRQDLETAQVPIIRWVDRKAVVHLHNGILTIQLQKKGEAYLLWQHGWTWRILCLVKHASQRKTNTIWPHLYVECNEQNRQRHIIMEQTDSYQRGEVLGDWMKEGEGIKQNNMYCICNTKTQTTEWWWLEGMGGGRVGGGGQRGAGNEDRKRLHLWRWAHNAVFSWCFTELYTWKLYGFANQCHPNKFN